jgi:hypothetical protein
MSAPLNFPMLVRRDYMGGSTEKHILDLAMNTNSTYASSPYGVSLSSSGRTASVVRLTGAFSGTSGGGLQGLFVRLTSTGTLNSAYHGVQAMKGVVVNSGEVTAGVMYGGMFCAVHSHATNKMDATASLIGVEGWAYDADGPVAVMLGGNIGYHNEEAGPQVSGSVHRALQIFCDDSASSNADESTGLCIWNMSGVQDAAIRTVHSGTGFTYLLHADVGGGAGYTATASTYTAGGTAVKLAIKVGTVVYYILGSTAPT